MQSDSDHNDDPDYIEEPTSPKISQAKGGCEKYRKRQNQKNMKSTPKSTKGGKVQHQLLHLLNYLKQVLEVANVGALQTFRVDKIVYLNQKGSSKPEGIVGIVVLMKYNRAFKPKGIELLLLHKLRMMMK